MARPPNIKPWATDADALVNEPSDTRKAAGFSTAQPSVNHFNWLFKRLFEWFEYLDENIDVGGYIYYVHSTARPRFELPFTLPATNQLQSIEVLREVAGTIGSAGGTTWSGSGSVTAGVSGEAGFTFVANQTKAAFNTAASVTLSYVARYTIASQYIWFNSGRNQLTWGSNRPSRYPLFTGSAATDNLTMNSMVVDVPSGNLRRITFNNNTARQTTLFRNIFQYEQPYIVAAANEAEMNAGNCIIWRLNRTHLPGTNVDYLTLNVAPVYKNMDVSLLDAGAFFGVVQSYSQRAGRTTSLTFTANQTKTAFNNRPNQNAYTYSQGTLTNTSSGPIGGVQAVGFRANTGQNILFSGSPVNLTILDVDVNISNGNLRLFYVHNSPSFSNRDAFIRGWNNILDYEQPYFIMAESLAEMNKGNCIIWRITRANLNRAIFPQAAPYNGTNNRINLAPVYKNVNVSTRLTFMKMVQSYQVTTSRATGSTLSTSISLNNSAPFNQASYAYDPSAQTIKVVLSGTVSQTAFYSLSIIKDSTTLITLLSSSATYHAGDKSFTWSNIASDPLPNGSTTTFSYASSGSGAPSYNFVVINTGLTVELYDNKHYLHIQPSSGVLNGDSLLIRKI